MSVTRICAPLIVRSVVDVCLRSVSVDLSMTCGSRVVISTIWFLEVAPPYLFGSFASAASFSILPLPPLPRQQAASRGARWWFFASDCVGELHTHGSTLFPSPRRVHSIWFVRFASSHNFSCIHVLTVNFGQPSHEFTFGVGINFISYLLLVTPLIWQVRSCMSVLEFNVYTKFSIKCETSG
jgi:hypothetical protein